LRFLGVRGGTGGGTFCLVEDARSLLKIEGKEDGGAGWVTGEVIAWASLRVAFDVTFPSWSFEAVEDFDSGGKICRKPDIKEGGLRAEEVASAPETKPAPIPHDKAFREKQQEHRARPVNRKLSVSREKEFYIQASCLTFT
jgi:hypothetical protein